MNQLTENSYYLFLKKKLFFYLLVLTIFAFLLGICHFWGEELFLLPGHFFDLDKERNLPTWFNGLLFFLLGISTLAAYYVENNIYHKNNQLFKQRWLWLGLMLFAFYISVDDMTILHENLFWLEVRQISEATSPVLKYLTQWQLLFSPAILLALTYLTALLAHRFSLIQKKTLFVAILGILFWIGALFFEGIRYLFKLTTPFLYSLEVLIEEEMEMIGTIFLIGAICRYSLELHFFDLQNLKNPHQIL